MRNYYKILDIPDFSDKDTVITAYQQKVALLMNMDTFNLQGMMLGVVKWDFTLRLLDELRAKIDATSCQQFLDALEQNYAVFPLLSDEAKKSLHALKHSGLDTPIIDSFQCTLTRVSDEINQKKMRLKIIEEAYRVLTSERKSLVQNRYLMFVETLEEATPLCPDLTGLVASFEF